MALCVDHREREDGLHVTVTGTEERVTSDAAIDAAKERAYREGYKTRGAVDIQDPESVTTASRQHRYDAHGNELAQKQTGEARMYSRTFIFREKSY